jgi:heme/copper-type cytochrome/quinol oxidase subunit 2
MQANDQHRDRCLLILLLAILIGLPAGISAYDRAVWRKQIPQDATVFTLTGHTDRGWILGEVNAYDILVFGNKAKAINKPIIRVRKGDRVVLKLKSSDVIHGFSLKELGIFIDDGIPPGKVRLVSFVADREGTFTFSCNAICGANHEKMQGTLVVTA